MRVTDAIQGTSTVRLHTTLQRVLEWARPVSSVTTAPHPILVDANAIGNHTVTLVGATPDFAVDADVINVTLSAMLYPNADG